MKVCLAIAGTLALYFAAGSGAPAQVAYTNSALNGCYAHLTTSVDTGAAAENRDGVGTLCFDGKGNIVASSKAPNLSGGVTNTNGTVNVHDDITGTYKVTNSPGDGMGIFEGRCARHAFVLRHVENGLAHGFSYILMTRKAGCKDSGPLVIGGNAEYLGPLQ
jgi:hypothetical protein